MEYKFILLLCCIQVHIAAAFFGKKKPKERAQLVAYHKWDSSVGNMFQYEIMQGHLKDIVGGWKAVDGSFDRLGSYKVSYIDVCIDSDHNSEDVSKDECDTKFYICYVQTNNNRHYEEISESDCKKNGKSLKKTFYAGSYISNGYKVYFQHCFQYGDFTTMTMYTNKCPDSPSKVFLPISLYTRNAGILCPNDSVLNGKVVRSKQNDIATVSETIQCFDGFQISGKSIAEITCDESTGTWNPERKCESIPCGDLPYVDHGRFKTENGRQLGDVAYLTCEAGYEESSYESSIRCQPGGIWSEPEASCRLVDCGSTPHMNNGEFITVNQKSVFESVATLECHSGYEPKNEDVLTIHCRASGDWSQPQTTCEGVYCGQPKTLPHGTITGDNYFYKDEIHFACDGDYRLIGSNKATCRADATWSSPNPKCEAIVCEHINIHNAEVDYRDSRNDYTDLRNLFVETTALVKCNRGYRLIGSEILECFLGNTDIPEWRPEIPSCEEITCDDPEESSNMLPISHRSSAYTIVTNKFGDVIDFRCEIGYNMQGIDHATCRENGWDSEVPTCKIVTCGDPGTIEHGKKEGDSYEYNQQVTFSCDDGYALEGYSSILCLAKGRWSNSNPKCIIKRCPNLLNMDHGQSNVQSTEFGSTVRFSCFPGYELQGEYEAECNKDGIWTNEVPNCIACEKDYYKVGITGNKCVKCPLNTHTLTKATSNINNCMCDEGTTKTVDGSCKEINCEELSPPENGILRNCGHTNNDVCSFYCEKGYILEGVRTVRCTKDGWNNSPQDTKCEACPINTYKEKEGYNVCINCPKLTHTDTIASHSITDCICNKGYDGPNGGPCQDVDECKIDNGGCEQTCINERGSHYCICSIPGYEIDEDQRSCKRVQSCLEIDQKPHHGQLQCNEIEDENSKICFITCDNGYFYVSGMNDYVTCGPTTDYIWSYQRVNASAVIPPCTEEFFVDLEMHQAFSYNLKDNSCSEFESNSRNHITEIVTNFAESFEECQNSCHATLDVSCSIGDVGLVAEVRLNVLLLNFNKLPVGPTCDSACARTNLRKSIGAGGAIKNKIMNAIKEGDSDLSENNDNAPTVNTNSYQWINLDILCNKSGHVLTKQRLCVPCAKGYFLQNPKDATCSACPRGSYQMHEGQTECEPCLEGSTTIAEGSVHPIQCSVPTTEVGFGLSLKNEKQEDIDIDAVLNFDFGDMYE